MPKELIESRWREVAETISSVRDLKHLLARCISLATERGYNVSEISHALHWQVEEVLYDYEANCALPDLTNLAKLSQLSLEELLGKISDHVDQCMPYALGDVEYFRNADCGLSDGETQTEHCRKCIAKWLDERR